MDTVTSTGVKNKLIHDVYVEQKDIGRRSPTTKASRRQRHHPADSDSGHTLLWTSSVVRAFAHGAIGRRIDPSW